MSGGMVDEACAVSHLFLCQVFGKGCTFTTCLPVFCFHVLCVRSGGWLLGLFCRCNYISNDCLLCIQRLGEREREVKTKWRFHLISLCLFRALCISMCLIGCFLPSHAARAPAVCRGRSHDEPADAPPPPEAPPPPDARSRMRKNPPVAS